MDPLPFVLQAASRSSTCRLTRRSAGSTRFALVLRLRLLPREALTRMASPVPQARPHAHLEFDQGFLIFDNDGQCPLPGRLSDRKARADRLPGLRTDGRSHEVYRRTADVVADVSLPSADRSVRGQFTHFATLISPGLFRAYRCVGRLARSARPKSTLTHCSAGARLQVHPPAPPDRLDELAQRLDLGRPAQGARRDDRHRASRPRIDQLCVDRRPALLCQAPVADLDLRSGAALCRRRAHAVAHHHPRPALHVGFRPSSRDTLRGAARAAARSARSRRPLVAARRLSQSRRRLPPVRRRNRSASADAPPQRRLPGRRPRNHELRPGHGGRRRARDARAELDGRAGQGRARGDGVCQGRPLRLHSVRVSQNVSRHSSSLRECTFADSSLMFRACAGPILPALTSSSRLGSGKCTFCSNTSASSPTRRSSRPTRSRSTSASRFSTCAARRPARSSRQCVPSVFVPRSRDGRAADPAIAHLDRSAHEGPVLLDQRLADARRPAVVREG